MDSDEETLEETVEGNCVALGLSQGGRSLGESLAGAELGEVGSPRRGQA